MSDDPKIIITTSVEQDDIPVRGNLIASGDVDFDKKQEDKVLARLERGDVWAWARVTVAAQCQGFVGKDHLGGCCYKDFNAFKRGGYWSDMVGEAIKDMEQTMRDAVKRGTEAGRLLLQVHRLPREEIDP